jgi:hypothetical protein
MSESKAEKKSTKKRRRESTDNRPVVAMCNERYDTDALGHIHELVLPHEIDRAVTDMWVQDQTVKPMFRTTRHMICYKASEEFKPGRVYASDPSLQSLAGWVRRIIAHKFYHDIDMENAFPTIYRQIVQKVLGSCPAIIEEYAINRKAVFDRAREYQGVQFTDAELKKLFLVTLHGGHYEGYLHELLTSKGITDTASNPVIEQFTRAVRRSARQLKTHKQYSPIYEAVKNDEKKTNKTGTFISRVCQMVECKALLAMAEYFTSCGRTVGCLIFDGLLLERKPKEEIEAYGTIDPDEMIPDDLLRGAEKYVLNRTGFEIKLLEKSLKPKDEDWVKYNGPKDISKIESTTGQQIELLVRSAVQRKLVRSDGHVYSFHPRVRGVYVRSEVAKDFINRALSGCNVFRGADMKTLEAWFDSNDHPHFPLITPSKIGTSIAFQNGYMDIDELKFYDAVPPSATKHFFDRLLDLESLDSPTPLWDQLLSAQLGERSTCVVCFKVALVQHDDQLYCRKCDPDESGSAPCDINQCDMLEILIGRLFYPIGKYDQWQLMPFLKGDANTGKSTVIDIVSRMFPVGGVGSITGTQEGTFGLEALFTKRLVIIPDMPKGFSKKLDQSDFQSILSGETVSIARKTKVAVNEIEWKAPLIGAGNFLPDYKDSSGSISRRLAVFPFVNLVAEKNTLLKHDVIENELVTVMLRCIFSYRQACDRFAGKEFWTRVAPRDLLHSQESVKEETNYLANFLQNGSPFYQIVHEDGAVTPYEELEKAFSNHLRIDHKIEREKIGSDHFPIKNAGFIIHRTNLCKTCNRQHSKESCGSHYDSRNRYRKTVVLGMKIVRKG